MAESRQMCSICCEHRIPRRFIEATNSCQHQSNVCSSCLKKHVEEEVNGKRRSTVMCPSSGCKAEILPDDAARIAGKKIGDILDKNLLNDYLKSDKDFRFCSNPNCGSGQIVADAAHSSFMTCNECETRTCIQHRCEWHSNMSCLQYDEWLQTSTNNQEKDMAWIRTHCTTCPKCGHGIQKKGGCDHMTCRREAGGCGHEFCYLCGADYAEIRQHDNSRHKRTCMYYTAA